MNERQLLELDQMSSVAISGCCKNLESVQNILNLRDFILSMDKELKELKKPEDESDNGTGD